MEKKVIKHLLSPIMQIMWSTTKKKMIELIDKLSELTEDIIKLFNVRSTCRNQQNLSIPTITR